MCPREGERAVCAKLLPASVLRGEVARTARDWLEATSNMPEESPEPDGVHTSRRAAADASMTHRPP